MSANSSRRLPPRHPATTGAETRVLCKRIDELGRSIQPCAITFATVLVVRAGYWLHRHTPADKRPQLVASLQAQFSNAAIYGPPKDSKQ